jgi:hypothetical protein
MGRPKGPTPTNWAKRERLAVVGQLTIDVHDHDLWNSLAHEAKSYGVPMSEIVHHVLAKHANHSEAVIRWRQEQDDLDPDLRVIREFLESEESAKSRKLRGISA